MRMSRYEVISVQAKRVTAVTFIDLFRRITARGGTIMMHR